jgi:translation initiation factor 2 beta subunit (eIF-2beta)/eIF-5
VALEWLNFSRECLEKDDIKFYCFGVNKNNVKNFWANPNDYEKNVYLRFFEVGLKSAIRWFNLEKITYSFLDNGRCDEDRQERVRWLNFDFFNSKLFHEIDPNNIKLLDSDENKSKSEFSNFIQLSDVLLGVVRSSFCRLGINQKGQKECVENFIDIIERFNDKKKAYNNCSRYWKKFCIQFFPSPNNLTKEEFLSDKIEDLLKRGNFYCDRKTYRQQIAEEKNLKLNF